MAFRGVGLALNNNIIVQTRYGRRLTFCATADAAPATKDTTLQYGVLTNLVGEFLVDHFYCLIIYIIIK